MAGDADTLACFLIFALNTETVKDSVSAVTL